MDVPTTLQILGSTERAAVISLSVHGLLMKQGQGEIAQLILLLHDEAADAAKTMGRELGVEVLEGLNPRRELAMAGNK